MSNVIVSVSISKRIVNDTTSTSQGHARHSAPAKLYLEKLLDRYVRDYGGMSPLGDYEERDALLLAMGFRNYPHYLESDLWKSIRGRVLERHPRCVCGKSSKQVHHRDYSGETLSGAVLTGLLGVCGRCHYRIEFNNKGEKRTFSESQKMCHLLLSGAGVPKKRKRKTSKWCLGCGNKAKRGADYCRLCFRIKRFGVARFPAVVLPRCQGKDCTYQARKESNYCRIHEVDPNLSLKDYYRFRKKAAKAGIINLLS